MISLILGSLWISEVGLQTDEALFAAGIYPPFGNPPRLFGKHRPLMLMTYVGALKSYVWKPVLRNFQPSAASVRFPAVLLASFTTWLFYLLGKRTVGVRAALVGTALLAVDPCYLLASRWDWGPVVLQHLLLVGGALAIVCFAQRPRRMTLFLGCFLFGLGIWDKTIFFWSLSGIAVATLIVSPGRVRPFLTRRYLGVAISAFLLGTFPLIVYNVKHRFVTVRANAKWSWEENIYGKLLTVKYTATGQGLFGSMIREDWEEPRREPDDVFKRVWMETTDALGRPRTNLFLPLLGCCVLLIPLVWRTRARKAVLFVVVFLLVAWPQMAFVPGAGAAVHHTILLWPLPFLAVGAVLAEASRRIGRVGVPTLIIVVGTVCLSSVAVIGTYYTSMLRFGGTTAWTDAINPLAEALPSMHPSELCMLDWGHYESIRLLHQGRILPTVGVDPDADAATAKRQMATPNAVYLTHTKGNEILAGPGERFLALAAAEGYRKTEERTFYDFNGRPVLEVFKLSRP